MLLGVLDIGSNSGQLQVFEARPGAPPLPTHAVKEPTLLGESFDPDGAIKPAGVDRVVEAVNRAMNAARRLGVQQLYVFNQSFDLPLRPLNGIGLRPGRDGRQARHAGDHIVRPGLTVTWMVLARAHPHLSAMTRLTSSGLPYSPSGISRSELSASSSAWLLRARSTSCCLVAG